MSHLPSCLGTYWIPSPSPAWAYPGLPRSLQADGLNNNWHTHTHTQIEQTNKMKWINNSAPLKFPGSSSRQKNKGQTRAQIKRITSVATDPADTPRHTCDRDADTHPSHAHRWLCVKVRSVRNLMRLLGNFFFFVVTHGRFSLLRSCHLRCEMEDWETRACVPAWCCLRSTCNFLSYWPVFFLYFPGNQFHRK